MYKEKYSGFFFLVFIKADGTERKIKCLINTDVETKGGSMSYDPISKGCIVVCDMDLLPKVRAGEKKSAYRSIKLERVEELHLEKEQYIVHE